MRLIDLSTIATGLYVCMMNYFHINLQNYWPKKISYLAMKNVKRYFFSNGLDKKYYWILSQLNRLLECSYDSILQPNIRHVERLLHRVSVLAAKPRQVSMNPSEIFTGFTTTQCLVRLCFRQTHEVTKPSMCWSFQQTKEALHI